MPLLRPTPVHVPHIPLTDYYQTEQDRQAYLRQIIDNTAANYDRIETMLAWGSGSRYRRQALIRGGLKTGMKVLDVGTGLVATQACILAGQCRPGHRGRSQLRHDKRSRPILASLTNCSQNP